MNLSKIYRAVSAFTFGLTRGSLNSSLKVSMDAGINPDKTSLSCFSVSIFRGSFFGTRTEIMACGVKLIHGLLSP